MISRVRFCRFTSCVTLFGLVGQTYGATITRDEIIDNAERYVAHQWTPMNDNICHANLGGKKVDTPDEAFTQTENNIPGWWRVGTVSQSVPYKWGGYDTLNGFDAAVGHGACAGDINTAVSFGSANAAGVDCSGFVTRAFGIPYPTKYGTGTLPKITEKLDDYADLRKGDILLKSGHVMLVADNYSGEVITVYEASSRDWRVSVRPRTPAQYAAYTPRTYFKPIDAVLVIDRSGSMFGANIANAIEGSKQFIDLLRPDDKVGVVSFSDSTTVNFPLTQIDDIGTVQNSAKASVGAITAGGATSIGAGLLAGKNQLAQGGFDGDGKQDPFWGMILLSDGAENTGPFVRDVLPGVLATKTKVYAIGLGAGADEALLRSIAEQTKGAYLFARSAAELRTAYNRIKAEVRNEDVVKTASGIVEQDATVSVAVAIDSSIPWADFSVTWPGSDLDVVLVAPDGSEITPTVADMNPNVRFRTGATYEIYSVTGPMPGLWTMRIFGRATRSGGEPYSVHVSGASALLSSLSFDRPEYLPGQQMAIRIDLEHPLVDAIVGGTAGEGRLPPRQPLVGATVSAEVETPIGVQSLLLYDDGVHGDNAANDGVYGNVFSQTQALGSYTVTASVIGTSKTNENFTRQITKATVVSSDSDGDGMSDVWEDLYGLDKLADDSNGDGDNDLLTNLEEYTARTSPTNPDTDGDGFSDGNEVALGSDPLDPESPSFKLVVIDIKPGSDDNTINLGSGGTVPVAILSSAEFDATRVDPRSISLASATVRLKGQGTPQASFVDVNGDGLVDLMVHVETSALQLTGDTQATLSGKTGDGISIQGTDTVRIVP